MQASSPAPRVERVRGEAHALDSWSTCSTSVRIARVTFLISAVSGGVSTSRLSVGTL